MASAAAKGGATILKVGRASNLTPTFGLPGGHKTGYYIFTARQHS